MNLKITRDNLELLLKDIYGQFPDLKIIGSVHCEFNELPRVFIEVKSNKLTNNKYFDYSNSFVLIFNLPAFTEKEINRTKNKVIFLLNAAVTFMEE